MLIFANQDEKYKTNQEKKVSTRKKKIKPSIHFICVNMVQYYPYI